MERTRRRAMTSIAVLLAFIVLLPGVGEAVFVGELRGDVPWTLDITPDMTSGAIAVTVFGLTKSDIRVMEMTTIPDGSAQFVLTSGSVSKQIRRISIDVAAAPHSVYQIRIIHGTDVITFDAIGDVVVVFDIVS